MTSQEILSFAESIGFNESCQEDVDELNKFKLLAQTSIAQSHVDGITFGLKMAAEGGDGNIETTLAKVKAKSALYALEKSGDWGESKQGA